MVPMYVSNNTHLSIVNSSTKCKDLASKMFVVGFLNTIIIIIIIIIFGLPPTQ